MDCIKIGCFIRRLRLEKGLTQRALAVRLLISDKAVSKWERGLGCPDLSLWPLLSAELGADLEAMLSGEFGENAMIGGNMKNTKYYVCPCCGNVLLATGEAAISCCGRKLEPLSPQKAGDDCRLSVTEVEDEWFVESDHPMEKEHYISFVAFVTSDRIQLIKLYPEWALQTRLHRRGHGMLLWYCTQHGLFYQLL